MARDAHPPTDQPPTTVDLAITVSHTRPDGDTPGYLTPYITWSDGLTPVERIQLAEAALTALAQEHTQAMADHTGTPDE